MNKVFLIISIVFLGISISCDTSFPTPVSFEDQLAIDLELIDEFLSENEIVAEKHESSIRFLLTEEGTGDNPRGTDDVKVKYTASLLNGQVVDSSEDGVTFQLSRLILAWQIMIPTMNEGGKMTIYAPSVYSYGNQGQGQIPPNANIIFDIELVEIVGN